MSWIEANTILRGRVKRGVLPFSTELLQKQGQIGGRERLLGSQDIKINGFDGYLMRTARGYLLPSHPPSPIGGVNGENRDIST